MRLILNFAEAALVAVQDQEVFINRLREIYPDDEMIAYYDHTYEDGVDLVKLQPTDVYDSWDLEHQQLDPRGERREKFYALIREHQSSRRETKVFKSISIKDEQCTCRYLLVGGPNDGREVSDNEAIQRFC